LVYNKVPGDRADVVITTPILLDVVTASLKSVIIKDGGRLVFSPDVDLAMISSAYILVENEGYFEIGSSDCLFDGNAEVLLTGMDHIVFSCGSQQSCDPQASE
jgi:hypothetical protein